MIRPIYVEMMMRYSLSGVRSQDVTVPVSGACNIGVLLYYRSALYYSFNSTGTPSSILASIDAGRWSQVTTT
jgi:hypothetical protein